MPKLTASDPLGGRKCTEATPEKVIREDKAQAVKRLPALNLIYSLASETLPTPERPTA
jgi:hypothetical protein